MYSWNNKTSIKSTTDHYEHVSCLVKSQTVPGALHTGPGCQGNSSLSIWVRRGLHSRAVPLPTRRPHVSTLTLCSSTFAHCMADFLLSPSRVTHDVTYFPSSCLPPGSQTLTGILLSWRGVSADRYLVAAPSWHGLGESPISSLLPHLPFLPNHPLPALMGFVPGWNDLLSSTAKSIFVLKMSLVV